MGNGEGQIVYGQTGVCVVAHRRVFELDQACSAGFAEGAGWLAVGVFQQVKTALQRRQPTGDGVGDFRQMFDGRYQ